MGLWARLRGSFWFIPALMCVGAVVLAEGLTLLERRLDDTSLGALDFLITTVGESGSRDLLGAIAGSMLTVASTTFSITIAVLALSSSTYGPRLVRNFMADRGNQLVLGTFVATFLYSLMVLRSVRVVGEGSGEYFVPHLAVNVAVLLAVASIGVLVYFIHHITDSVQVWTLAGRVRTDLVRTVDRLYPRTGRPVTEPPAAADVPVGTDEGARVTSTGTGYVRAVDVDGLVSWAADRDVLVAVRTRVGQHVHENAKLAVVWPPADVDDDACRSLRGFFHLGRTRTPDEDVEYSALLLEEMAVRALSPGTNDPYTAINALDNLASGLVVLAGRAEPSPYRRDADGRLRVVAPGVSLTGLLDHVLDAMRVYALEHPTVLHRTVELVEQVADASDDASVLLTLDDHLRLLVEAFAASSPHDRDLAALRRHADQVHQELVSSL